MNKSDFMRQYGPVALVTGASSGIGKSYARALATIGMDLVLVARRVDRLETLAAELHAKHGVRVSVRQLDLSTAPAAAWLVESTAAFDIGLLVSNAGFGLKGAHGDNDAQAMTDMLMVNCNIPMLLARAFIPKLKLRGTGGILLTSSVEGLIGCPYSTAYAASKAFVNSLGEGLWGELTPLGIDVLTLCPGATDTEAPALQGIDAAKLQHLMSPDEVVRLALENIKNGPVFIASEHYRAVFDRLMSMPRRDALTVMAQNMKP